MDFATSPFAFLCLSEVIRALRGQLGNMGAQKVLSHALLLLTHRRLGEISRAMDRLVARFRAGTLRPVSARVAVDRVVSEGAVVRTRARPDAVLPRKFGWLVDAGAWRAAVYGGQLRLVLQKPEMVELLIAAPQAARILRPLCRMLLVETSLLRPRAPGSPPEDVAEVVPKVVKKRVRKPRPKVDWGNIPLPRGMMAWAKKQGFGKVPRD